jgi:hypothetical protein
MRLFRGYEVLIKLETCKHSNTSFANPNLTVCFDCGATRRPDEEGWVIPWIWRKP